MARPLVFIALIMLLAGIAIGAGVTTLLWQGLAERRLSTIKEAQNQTEQVLTIAENNLQSLKKCTASLNDLVDTVRRK